MFEDIDHKDTHWYVWAVKVPSTTQSLIPDHVREASLRGLMPKRIKCVCLDTNEWNKVYSLFDTYCKMSPQVVVPEIVPCVCVTLCHIMWKNYSVLNRDSNIFRAWVVENLGRWIIQQGYAKTFVHVTQNTIIQLTATILKTLGSHLDPQQSVWLRTLFCKMFWSHTSFPGTWEMDDPGTSRI